MSDAPATPPQNKPKPAHAKPGSSPASAEQTERVIEPRQPDGPPGKSYFWGTGRRKRAIARVRVRPGKGEFKINGRDADDYFHLPVDRHAINKPLEATGAKKRVDVFVNVRGGGTTGQAGAIVLGIARALKICNPDYEPMLRAGHFLSRDPRKVERKKYGQSGARRRFQFSKR